MELTQEQRIDIIRELHNKVRGLPVNDEVLNFVENFKAEEAMEEIDVVDPNKSDIEDESQFLFTQCAESIDEEDEDFGLSEEMRSVYKNN